MPHRVRVFAPASISNLGPGFDVVGLALHEPGDIIEAELADGPGVEIVEVTGDDGLLSRDAEVNVAGVAAADVLQRFRAESGRAPARSTSTPAPQRGVRLWVHKRMPLASGLGSSAASSVAGAFAVNELLGRPYSRRELLPSAMEGERVASGAAHADNVAPSLLGGIVLIRSYDPLELIDLPAPPDLVVVVVHPHCAVPTAAARAILTDRPFQLADAIANLGNLGALVSALHRGDLQLLGRAVEDRLVEPLRAHLIPGFAAVKSAALSAGAFGCSIAGAGPSMFAFAPSREKAAGIATAMRAAFLEAAGLGSDVFVGTVNTLGAAAI